MKQLQTKITISILTGLKRNSLWRDGCAGPLCRWTFYWCYCVCYFCTPTEV